MLCFNFQFFGCWGFIEIAFVLLAHRLGNYFGDRGECMLCYMDKVE